jgi:hypothetical protein
MSPPPLLYCKVRRGFEHASRFVVSMPINDPRGSDFHGTQMQLTCPIGSRHVLEYLRTVWDGVILGLHQ